MKKVIITGANGFIGKHLIEKLLANDIEVHAISRSQSEFDKKVNIYTVDLLNPQLSDFFKGLEANAIFHLAWESPSGNLRANIDEQLKNITITNNVCKLAQNTNCARIISTGTVYEELCAKIDMAKSFVPMSYYLYTKKYAYGIMKQFCLQNSIKLIWCTFCHPIGKYNKTNQVIADSIIKLKKGQPLNFGHGENYFDIITVEDLVNGLYLAANSNLEQTRYYIGSNYPAKFKEYLTRIRDMLSPNTALYFDENKKDGLDLNKEWLDCSLFSNETGYTPNVDFSMSITKFAEWLEKTNLNGGFYEMGK